MAKKTPKPGTLLGQEILAELARRREAGDNYPCPLTAAAAAVKPDVTPDEINEALKVAPLKAGVILAVVGDVDAQAALKEDIPRLVADEKLMQTLLSKVCTQEPRKPTAAMAELTKQLPTPLKKPFEAHWFDLAASNSLPAFVRFLPKGKPGKKPAGVFHDRRIAIPDLEASEKLVAELQSQRELGGSYYPTTFARLCELTGLNADSDIVREAVKLSPYQEAVRPLLASKPKETQPASAPLYLAGDEARMLGQSIFILGQFREQISDDNQSVEVDAFAKGAKLAPPLRGLWGDLIRERFHTNSLSPGLGALQIKQKWHIVELARIRPQDGTPPAPKPVLAEAPAAVEPESPAPAAVSAVPASNATTTATELHAQPAAQANVVSDAPVAATNGTFESAFTAAFDQLDAARGGRNYLKLLPLRQATPGFSRSEFDMGLKRLQDLGLYTLESSEGNVVTLSDEEREAGILEGGTRFIYCRRMT